MNEFHRLVRGTPIINKISRYFLVGGVAAIVEWLMFALCHYGLFINYVLSGVVAFAVALAVNYSLSLKFVFIRGRHSRELEVLYVFLVSIAGAGINIGLMVVLVEVLGVHIMAAKIISTGATFFWNFLNRHLWIFHR